MQMAEVLAASDCEDEKKRFTTLNDEQFKNTFVQKRCQNHSKGHPVSFTWEVVYIELKLLIKAIVDLDIGCHDISTQQVIITSVVGLSNYNFIWVDK